MRQVSSISTPVGATVGKKVPLHTVFAFGAPGLPLAALLVITGVYLPRYYVQLGVDFIAVGAAIGVIRLLDIFLDPALGLLIDRTKTPIGRYRPWLILGAPIAAFGMFKVLAPDVTVSPGYMVLWLLIAYAGNSMVTLGVASWASVLATNYNDRSRVYGWTQGLAVCGSAGLLLLSVLTHGKIILGKAASMPTIGLIMAIAFPVTALICILLTPERASAAPRPTFSLKDMRAAIVRPSMVRIIFADLLLTLGPGATAPIYVYFFKDAKGFSVTEVGLLLIFYIGAGIVGSPVWGGVARKVGKHRTIQIACVAYAVAQTLLMALPRVFPHHTLAQAVPTVAGMFAVGFCASAFIPIVRAMVADVVDEVRLATGQDLTSLLYSMVTTTTKVGAAITVAFIFPILKAFGYNGKDGVVNTPHAIFGLEMCYLFAPIILVFLGGSMFFGYKLDAKRHGEIRAALEAQSVNDPAAAEESLVGVVSAPPEAAG
jgi:GPH family glycoside/pentoside/hexuronide:cation symporter